METRKSIYWLRRHGLATAVGVAIAVLIVVLFLRRGSKPAEEEPAPVVNVKTTAAVVKPLVTRLQALGTVQARPGHIAEISAPESSRIVAVYVAVGDAVRAGQPLVQLDKTVFAAKRREAEVTLTSAQQAYNRAERLQTEGIAPRKDVEAAATDVAKARADLEQARRTEALATLRSPISGIVVTLNAALSMPVDVAQKVVAVVDPHGLEILFHLSPSDAGRVTTGMKVELTSGPENRQLAVGTGTITGVSAAVDSATGAVTVRATIATPSRLLKVGETLNGGIKLASPRGTVVVPVEALVPEGDETIVYVVDDKHIAHATKVKVGNRTESEAEILSGLSGGEIVVSSGAYGVTDGAQVATGPAK